jgi:hypothetical protein
MVVLQTMLVVVAEAHPLLGVMEPLLVAMVETARPQQLIQFPLFTQGVEVGVV